MRVTHVWSAVALLGLGLVGAACGDDEEVFVATLGGANEVPAVTTSASGTATFTLMQDGTVAYVVTVSNIQNVTASHIHDGAAGANGPVAVTFDVSGFSGTSGTLAAGTLTGGTNVSGMSFQQLVDKMRTGGVYVNVHTQANPGGEIRGQIAAR